MDAQDKLDEDTVVVGQGVPEWAPEKFFRTLEHTGRTPVQPDEERSLKFHIQKYTPPSFEFGQLLVPDDIAKSFVIIGLFADGKPHRFNSSSPIPARVFAQSAIGILVGFDKAKDMIEIRIKNVSTEPKCFECTLRSQLITPS